MVIHGTKELQRLRLRSTLGASKRARYLDRAITYCGLLFKEYTPITSNGFNEWIISIYNPKTKKVSLTLEVAQEQYPVFVQECRDDINCPMCLESLEYVLTILKNLRV